MTELALLVFAAMVILLFLPKRKERADTVSETWLDEHAATEHLSTFQGVNWSWPVNKERDDAAR